MKVCYFYDSIGEIDESYEDKINLVGFDTNKNKMNIGYIYILNIKDADVCKIGTSQWIFNRIASLRQIIKSIFPYIENSITYNVYISKPVKHRFELENNLHKHFQKDNIDGEWFKCSFHDAIKVLQNTQKDFVFEKGLEHVRYMISNNGYKKYLLDKEFNRIKHLKCLLNLNFKKFLLAENPKLFTENYLELSENCTPNDLLLLLEKYLLYLKSGISIEQTTLNNRKFYSYRINAQKQVTEFIKDIKEGKYNAD